MYIKEKTSNVVFGCIANKFAGAHAQRSFKRASHVKYTFIKALSQMKSKKNVQFVHFRIRFQKFGFFLLTLSPVRYLYGFACSWANHRSLFGFFLCKQHFSVYFLNVSVCVSFVLCSLDVFCALVLWCPSCREHRRLQTIFFLF